MTPTFRHLTRAFCRLTRTFPRLTQTSRQVTRTFQEGARTSRRLTRSFNRIAETFREDALTFCRLARISFRLARKSAAAVAATGLEAASASRRSPHRRASQTASQSRKTRCASRGARVSNTDDGRGEVPRRWDFQTDGGLVLFHSWVADFFGSVHFQFRISGKSSPCLAM